MAKKSISSPLLVSFLFFSFSTLPCFHGCNCFPSKRGLVNEIAETHGMFVFGSSLVDNGNNNFVENSTVRVDYLPYGIDFPWGPSGRFSNGKNVIDGLTELLKLPHFIPPFANPFTKGTKIVRGVNYASGGSGILDETGFVSGGRVIPLTQQIKNFEEVTLSALRVQLRCNNISSLSRTLSNYLFVVGSGGNDYILNYFLPNKTNKPPIQDFTRNLTLTMSNQIKKLYSLGARKFMLVSVYPLGCIPLVKRTIPVAMGCIDLLNQAALLFNSQMKSSVDDLKPEMPGSNIVYVNSYQIMMDTITNPISQGFSDTDNACCEVSSNGVLCKREGVVCKDRREYVFFDGLHPTEAMNVLIANRAYSSNVSTEVYPFNVQQLVKLQADYIC